jgi:Skp family chaperone for outer membrane proteins
MNLKKSIALSIVSVMMMGSMAFAAPEPQKIAVIDIQKVVSASSQVKALKKSQEAKNKELQKFIKTAQDDINKQSTEKNKKTMAEKYEKQLQTRKEANLKEYTAKLQEADKNITAQIGQQARAMGYTMVLPKTSVVIGGDDITEAVIKVIK